ncbi:putative thiamine transporter SLC35F3 isoform X2 [Fukomys damarensis]|uniref:putative thiamine transporter SLC35F3 isoform X2 n=1 Tax=Fukomys damarensis TaxID=885580 RepID=UPI001455D844|nr:putative thiamine transporter SLC35F3 isoform X2 [Fukomys damarensis]
MRRSPDVSPRRLSDISPQLRQLKYLVVDEAIKEDLKWSRSVEDLTSGPVGLTSIEERILRITGYYGYQPWAASYKREERPQEPPGPTEAPASVGSDAGGRTSRRRWTCSRGQLQKTFWGVAVVLCVCASWAGAAQLAKLTFRTFDAPFTLTWFATNWNFLFFPLYYAGHVCKSTEKQSVKQRECCRFFGDNGLTLKVFFTKAAPFGVLWTLTNYLYLHAIKKINTTDVSVLFCCNKAFVFLLSWIVLRDRFMGVRIVAAILAIAGIVMMTYADGFHSHSVIGIALVVGSASMSALYKVLFKLLLGSAKFGEAALFLSILGVFNILFITCIPVILYFTKVEYWSSFDDIPWGNLCGFSILLLTFNIVLNFGIAVTYPTLMSLGIVLSVPVNAAHAALHFGVSSPIPRLTPSLPVHSSQPVKSQEPSCPEHSWLEHSFFQSYPLKLSLRGHEPLREPALILLTAVLYMAEGLGRTALHCLSLPQRFCSSLFTCSK